MGRLPTVSIVNHLGERSIINESDFDPETMTLWGSEAAAGVAAPAAPKPDPADQTPAALADAVARAEKAEAALVEAQRALADERAVREAAEKAKTDAEAKLETLRSDHAEAVRERDEAKEKAAAAQAKADEATQKLEAAQAPDRMSRIKAAIGTLDRADKNLWTGAGIPRVEVIEAAVGFNISAAERNEAWEELSGGGE